MLISDFVDWAHKEKGYHTLGGAESIIPLWYDWLEGKK